MKKITYTLAAALTAMALSLTGCELDEYNPGAGTGGDKSASFVGFEGLQTYCYEPLYGQLFSTYDLMSLTETGTDIFLCCADGTYTKELIYYEGLATNTNAVKKVFGQLYSQINGCNAIIEKADKVADGKPEDVKVLTAEAKALRAYYYLMLATQYGEITLNTVSSEVSVDTEPKRTPIAEIYAQIITDLKEAAADLDIKPYNDQYARVSQKTALGLLARAYAQGAGEGLTEGGTSYWQKALETAEELIENKDAYGIYMYDNIEDLWAQANNRNNPEALFIAAGHNGMMASAYNTAKNNLFSYCYPKPNDLGDIYVVKDNQNYLYGRVNNNVIAPSKYLVDLFDEDLDTRWNNSFTCAFGVASGVQAGWTNYIRKNATVLIWTQKLADKYGKDASVVGDTIYPYADYNYVEGAFNQYPAKVWKKGDHTGDIKTALTDVKNIFATPYPFDIYDDRFSIYLSKKPLTTAERASSPIVIYNLDELFDAEGKYHSESFDGTNSYKLFPGLAKYNWNYEGVFGQDIQRRNGDVMIMRTAELYLIAAEAAERMGDGGKAARYLNVIRERACRDKSLFDSKMKLAVATEQDVLDEYARELCGEFCRWALLKRHHAFEKQLPKGNKRAAANFDPSKHYNRPISYEFLSQINNADEYGTNGY